jgi:integrase
MSSSVAMPAAPLAQARRPVKVPGHPGLFRKGSTVIDTWKDRGKPRSKSYRTLTAAKRGRAERIAAGNAPASRERFDRYAERWLREYRGRTANGLASSTRADYRWLIETYAVPFFRHTPIGDLTPLDVKNFIEHLATCRPVKRQKGAERLSPATVRRIMCPLKAMLAEAYELGLTRSDVGKVRVVVRDERPRRRAPKTLTRDQVTAVVAELAERDRLLFFFLARTGVRISEALGAQWRDLEQTSEGPVLIVERQQHRGGTRDELKTEAGHRRVAIVPSLARALMRHRASTEHAADDAPIFPSLAGTAQDDHNVRRRLRPAAKRAGVPWATPHVFRHSLATELRDAGYDAAVISKVLGHTDEGFTRRVYIHTRDAPRFDDLDDTFTIEASE